MILVIPIMQPRSIAINWSQKWKSHLDKGTAHENSINLFNLDSVQIYLLSASNDLSLLWNSANHQGLQDSVMIFGRSIGTGPAMAIASTPGLAGQRVVTSWVWNMWKNVGCWFWRGKCVVNLVCRCLMIFAEGTWYLETCNKEVSRFWFASPEKGMQTEWQSSLASNLLRPDLGFTVSLSSRTDSRCFAADHSQCGLKKLWKG